MQRSVEADTHLFWQAVDAFRQVQLQHTEALQKGRLQNIWQWQEERSKVFVILQKALDQLMNRLQLSARSDREDTLRGVTRAVTELMEEETVLQRAVEQQRGEVLRRLQKLRCGKRSLLAYRSAAPGSARPRFLNSKS